MGVLHAKGGRQRGFHGRAALTHAHARVISAYVGMLQAGAGVIHALAGGIHAHAEVLPAAHAQANRGARAVKRTRGSVTLMNF